MKKHTNCIICAATLKGKQTVFCSIRCKNTYHQSYPSQKQRSLKRKSNLVKEAGGKCTRCGYYTNLAALAFHHLDPKKKDFKLDARSLSNRTLEKVERELSKCILLCHNCHAEIHNPEMSLS